MTNEEQQILNLQTEAVQINQQIKAEFGELFVQIIALKAKLSRLEAENEELRKGKEVKEESEKPNFR